MTRDEIIELALTVFDEHPYDKGHVVSPTGYTWIDDSLVEFANLVAAKERERCAQVCEKEGLGAKHQGDVYAHAIRSLK